MTSRDDGLGSSHPTPWYARHIMSQRTPEALLQYRGHTHAPITPSTRDARLQGPPPDFVPRAQTMCSLTYTDQPTTTSTDRVTCPACLSLINYERPEVNDR